MADGQDNVIDAEIAAIFQSLDKAQTAAIRCEQVMRRCLALLVEQRKGQLDDPVPCDLDRMMVEGFRAIDDLQGNLRRGIARLGAYRGGC